MVKNVKIDAASIRQQEAFMRQVRQMNENNNSVSDKPKTACVVTYGCPNVCFVGLL